MLQHILVGLDGSPLAESILPYVVSLARGLHARVTALHVASVPDEIRTADLPGAQELIARARADGERYAQGVVERFFRNAGVPAAAAVEAGQPAKEIVAYADRERVGLIALATHGRSGLQRWLRGSVAEDALSLTRVPVLLLRPSEDKLPPAPEIRRILVPVDGSVLSESVLVYVRQLSDAFRAPIGLIRVVEPVYFTAEPAVGAMPAYEAVLEALQSAAEDNVSAVAARLREAGYSVSTSVMVGSSASVIVDDAQSYPGTLVVIATHGRTGMTGLVLGSVARRVALQSGMPTLVVRPELPH